MSDAIAEAFWAGCAAGELRYQRCGACGSAQFYPRPFCRRCGGTPAWVVSGGRGTVYAVTRVTRAPTADFAALAPYDILLVDLDEGFRMMAHGAPGLAIGDRVSLGFRSHGARALPRFERL
ncbi:MAG TPA: OB-fold domain-containing protein [Stellaceae bacterium]|nr:OB-fold domain-containing protein [Stellaceae bacterium]